MRVREGEGGREGGTGGGANWRSRTGRGRVRQKKEGRRVRG